MASSDISATDLKRDLGEITERAGRGERIRVLRHKRAYVAVISAEDLARLEEFEDRILALEAEARLEASAEAGDEPTPIEEVRRNLGLE